MGSNHRLQGQSLLYCRYTNPVCRGSNAAAASLSITYTRHILCDVMREAGAYCPPMFLYAAFGRAATVYNAPRAVRRRFGCFGRKEPQIKALGMLSPYGGSTVTI